MALQRTHELRSERGFACGVGGERLLGGGFARPNCLDLLACLGSIDRGCPRHSQFPPATGVFGDAGDAAAVVGGQVGVRERTAAQVRHLSARMRQG